MNNDIGHEALTSKKLYHAPELIALGPIQVLIQGCPGIGPDMNPTTACSSASTS